MGGKDSVLRVINLDNMSGQRQPGALGGELSALTNPIGGEIDAALTTWTDSDTVRQCLPF